MRCPNVGMSDRWPQLPKIWCSELLRMVFRIIAGQKNNITSQIAHVRINTVSELMQYTVKFRVHYATDIVSTKTQNKIGYS